MRYAVWSCTSLVAATLLAACGAVFASPAERAATATGEAIDRIAAQTLQALRTEEAVARQPTKSPTETATVLPATATGTPTATPWPAPVQISVGIDTNCRSGPGSQYPMIGALMVGETTIVRARVPELEYWIVENPDNPGRTCWLWARHATPEGATDHLPLAAPPWTATPEPGSIAGYVYIDIDGDGLRGDTEPPLSGITLTLRSGACPGGTGAAIVQTDGEGRYVITGLIPNLYCLLRPEDEPLNPNTWTILLGPGQVRDGVNFWRTP